MDLVGLPDLHSAPAVLEGVRGHLIGSQVLGGAHEAGARILGKATARRRGIVSLRVRRVHVILALVLRAQMEVHVHQRYEVGLGIVQGRGFGRHLTDGPSCQVVIILRLCLAACRLHEAVRAARCCRGQLLRGRPAALLALVEVLQLTAGGGVRAHHPCCNGHGDSGAKLWASGNQGKSSPIQAGLRVPAPVSAATDSHRSTSTSSGHCARAVARQRQSASVRSMASDLSSPSGQARDAQRHLSSKHLRAINRRSSPTALCWNQCWFMHPDDYDLPAPAKHVLRLFITASFSGPIRCRQL